MLLKFEFRRRNVGYLFGIFIGLLIIQCALCDPSSDPKPKSEDVKTETTTKNETKTEKRIKVIKKAKIEKPVIIVAQKVESPQNWNSWTPAGVQNSTTWTPVSSTFPQTTPLSIEELKRQKLHQIEQDKREQYLKNAYKKPKQNNKGKVTIESLKKQVMYFGRNLFNTFTGTNLGQLGDMAGLVSAITESFSGGVSGRQNGHDSETSESQVHQSYYDYSNESRGGALDWLSRLIGVQGKTLGEFLREYQVHVLYDLVFIFFKWIFFVYAGLLIP